MVFDNCYKEYAFTNYCFFMVHLVYGALQSSVNVILHFVSPESAAECIHLIDELRLLPEEHEARVDKLEVSFTIWDYPSKCEC